MTGSPPPEARQADREMSSLQTLCVFALALSVRLAAFWLHGQETMFAKYHAAARAVAGGELQGARLLDFSPFYLELHRLWLAAGLAPRDLTLAQAVVGAISCVLVARIAGRFLGGRGGALAGILLALHREAIVYDPILEPETFVVFFAVVSFRLGQEASARGAGAWRAAAAGLAAGLGIATRPSVWALVPVLWLVAAFRTPERLSGLRAPHALAFAAALLVCVVAVGLRSAALGGGVTMSPGSLLYQGNNSMASGLFREDFLVRDFEAQLGNESPDFAHQIYRDVAVADGGPADAPGRYWIGRAIAWISEYPGAAFRLLVRKLLAIGQPTVSFDFPLAARIDRGVAAWPLWSPSLAFAFGIAGFATSRRLWPVAGMFVSACAMLLIFFVSHRYRVPLAPWLAIGSAAFVVAVASRFRRALGSLVPSALTASCLLGLVYAPLPPGRYASQHAEAAHAVGLAHRRAASLLREDRLAAASGKLGDALLPMPWKSWKLPLAGLPFDQAALAEGQLERARAIAQRQDTSWAWLRYAVLLDFAGRAEAADGAYSRSVTAAAWVGDGRLIFRAQVGRGALALREGRLAASREAFEDAQRILPGAPEALVGLALTASGEEREAYLAAARRVSPGPEVSYFHGRMALDAGRPEVALAPLERLTRALPGYARGRTLFAAALHRTGHLEQALEQLVLARRSHRELLDPVYQPLEIAQAAVLREPDATRSWARLASRATLVGDYAEALRGWRGVQARRALTPGEKARLGRLHLRHGHPDEAVPLLESALAERPDLPDLAADLERARRGPARRD